MIRNFYHVLLERWANWHPMFRFLVWVAVLAVVGFFTLKPGYRMFKAWRLGQNLESARKAADENRMSEARDLSLTVLRGGDQSIDAYRILEQSTGILRDPRHADIARALMAHPESSEEDRWRGFCSVAADMPLGVVGQAWVSLGSERAKDPRFAEVFGRRLLEEKHVKEAALVLMGVPEEKRDGSLVRTLARVWIGSGRKEGFDEAQRMVAAAFAADGADAGLWIGVLEEIPAEALQENLLKPIRSRLDAGDAGDAGDAVRRALMVARIEYAAQSARRIEIVEESIARWKDAAPMALAQFLCDLGYDSLLLETFPAAFVNDHPELCPRMVGAAGRAGAWERVPELLDVPGNPMSNLEQLAHRAVHAARTAGPSSAWDAAIEEARRTTTGNDFLTLSRIAGEAGLTAEAESALVEAICLGRGPLPLYADLKPLLTSLQQRERDNQLLEICSIYLPFEPGNPVLLTQYAYLDCLNNRTDPAMLLKAIEPIAKALPKEVPVQCVLATIHLCAGQAAKAAETLDPLKLDPAQLPPAFRAALMTTLILNGRMTEEDPLVKEFPWKSLLPSERRKFSELIRSVRRED